MTTYTARVARSEQFWAVYVPEVDRWTQARTLREVEPMVRDLVSVMEQVPDDAIRVEVQITTPAGVAEHLSRSRQLTQDAAAARAAAAFESRQAALELHNDGVPLRDVGIILGVSYQRAHQLVTEAEVAARELQSS